MNAKNSTYNIAVILAGGSGSRMGGDLPKQFLMLGGKTVLEYAVEAFEQNPHIHEIAVVCAPEWKAKVEELTARNAWTKLKKILPGGKERYRSTLSAVEAYRNTPNVNLIFHDAARPLLSQRIIDEVAQALKTHQAVDVALPCTDTILQVNGGFIQGVPDRNTLMRSQTPQAFALEVIAKAYDIALKDTNFTTTDDCGTVLRYLPEIPIFIVPGDERNLKLTHPQDLPVLERLVQTK
ncbi:MAG: 2-C-methyl-D-erythritol 4-phosphate cytidylyltransferase [Bacteroides sp.]|nr:2-C-methyl-D-erythritol 4-phosphate cytidylyltransferase [Ruminococcus flavefaciens]MCM1554521.1 2-C-methyl-D-erythritol 4-phosphate cytidylyltransferase [Bacteroides sp.]